MQADAGLLWPQVLPCEILLRGHGQPRRPGGGAASQSSVYGQHGQHDEYGRHVIQAYCVNPGNAAIIRIGNVRPQFLSSF